MEISQDQVDHFHRNGFFFVPNPLSPAELSEIETRQREVEPEWEAREFPDAFNRSACQFLMVGEPLLRMVERPEFVGAARVLLGVEEIHVGAIGLGDASRVVSVEGRPQQQVQWHCDGGPDVRQVSIRTALDRHGPGNAPLRILPGSQHRTREEVGTELMQIELAGGRHDEPPQQCYSRHPHEVEVVLDPRWNLVWTPSCWHATGVKTAPGPRRAISFYYFPAGGRKRDLEAVKLLGAAWEEWPEARRRLWGLLD